MNWRPPPGRGWLLLTTLRFEPLGHPLVKLLLEEGAPGLDGLQAVVDLLAHVDVVLDVFEGGVFWEKVQEAQDFFFGGVHREDSSRGGGSSPLAHPLRKAGGACSLPHRTAPHLHRYPWTSTDGQGRWAVRSPDGRGGQRPAKRMAPIPGAHLRALGNLARASPRSTALGVGVFRIARIRSIIPSVPKD